jgi:hypothetical protein
MTYKKVGTRLKVSYYGEDNELYKTWFDLTQFIQLKNLVEYKYKTSIIRLDEE